VRGNSHARFLGGRERATARASPVPLDRAMGWRRYFTKRRLLILVGAALLYTGLWFLTHRFGVPQVRGIAVAAMHVPIDYKDVARQTDRVTGPVYYCSSRAYAPFLVRADYGWQGGPLYGDGGSALYLWFFGRAFRIRELEHWMS